MNTNKNNLLDSPIYYVNFNYENESTERGQNERL